MEKIKGNVLSISINGVAFANIEEVKLSLSIDQPKFLILTSNDPIVVECVDKSMVTPENILGAINDNTITFIQRGKLSLADCEFIILNADERHGFEINSSTIYQF